MRSDTCLALALAPLPSLCLRESPGAFTPRLPTSALIWSVKLNPTSRKMIPVTRPLLPITLVTTSVMLPVWVLICSNRLSVLSLPVLPWRALTKKSRCRSGSPVLVSWPRLLVSGLFPRRMMPTNLNCSTRYTEAFTLPLSSSLSLPLSPSNFCSTVPS